MAGGAKGSKRVDFGIRAALVGLCFLLALGHGGVARAQDSPPAAANSDSGSGCPKRPDPGRDVAANVTVTLDPETFWRPRGAEVHFTVNSRTGGTLQVQSVQVCFGWSSASGVSSGDQTVRGLLASPVLRAIPSDKGGAYYGAVVPDLPRLSIPWLHGLRSEVAYTALYTVPIADMVVSVTLNGGAPMLLLVPVGVTNVPYASILVALCVAAFFLILRAFVAEPRSGVHFLLRVVSSPDGYASLSRFQVLLWTVTVGASAVFVMVLSGNLINLTDGTLVLLGIAGAAALAARLPAGKAAGLVVSAPGGTPQNPRSPKWSDLVVVNGGVDQTRVQMLVFTLISAAFVVLKVIVGFSIPEIPTNFLLLMGISNGVYVAGRQLPDLPDGPLKQATTAPAP